MPYVTNQGIRIYYEVEGHGPPLVLAHGISASLMMGGTQPYARDERPPRTGLPTPKPFPGLPDGNNPIDQLLTQGREAWAGFFEANMEVSASMKRRLIANDFEAVNARLKTLHVKSLSRYLDPVQMPCLIYVGEDEPAYGGAKQLTDRLPNAEFVAFPGLHHYEMFTRVDVVLPEILRFLSKAG